MKMKKKMEEKRVVMRSVLMVWLVLGILVEPTRASFKSCYGSCFLICLITPNHSAFGCSFQCLKDCILQPPNTHLPAQSHTLTRTTTNTTTTTKNKNNVIYFCKLGCASSLCTNISSKNDPRSEKVERCVDSCSETCTTNN
ncbi:Thionin-like protein [Trema orientale]|uniref:Thionin-like protein n=1 Tax=Trema orientale TaxID=63057 RepID=A0A2P5CCY7_TREOI|nr:Thionin-like protein [Trema orientale]